MIISLIGLSGSGKSFWARRFEEELAYQRICCDDRIEQKLQEELTSAGINGIRGVAYWMGQPYEPCFAEHQAAYLRHEYDTVAEIVDWLREKKAASPDYRNENIIIDTTGSLIYLNPELCRALAELSTIVYLAVPQADQNQLFRQYLSDPKPVVWGDLFEIKQGEDPISALARCYPQLLKKRSAKYEQYAEVTINVSFNDRANLQLENFLKRIEDAVHQQ